MKCAACGNDNPEDALFCAGCGASLISGRVTARPGLPTVGFDKAIIRGFANYFTFSGRASRPEYWWWQLFTAMLVLVSLPGTLLLLVVLSDLNPFLLIAIIPLTILAIFIPSLAVTSRRLHDIGKSGWWQILPLGALAGWLILEIVQSLVLSNFYVPSFIRQSLVLASLLGTLLSVLFPCGEVLLLVWQIKKGDEGPNKYGPDPRQPTSRQP